ncbi:hypothetical protein SLEP1_g47323 [Rubroshorea leprosula]|uniref:Uncharacterized protein n=1 Tax=Rubroshorea leprosula TaxID=152421 RepID=A0AAV5LPZ3_9ROSI|nr:hypothetical protein SLEP1_g47323 [Rubroshorea leprosula]
MERARVGARGATARTDGGSRRRQVSRGQLHGVDNQINRQVKTFFFYNFPENSEAADLWYDFAKYGKVVDVFVPRKRDKWGKRFGFVRMAGVQNEDQMEKWLNEIWIGYYKMRVKIANKIQNQGARNKKASTAAKVKWTKVGMNRLVQPGQSYAQAVVGNSSEGEQVDVRPTNAKERVGEALEPVQALRLVEKEEVGSSVKLVAKEVKMGGVEKQQEEVIIEITPTEEELQWLEGSMVASMKSLASIMSIQDRMDVDGGLITISPLGGRSVLLMERVRGFLMEYMQHNKETFDSWFENIQPWRAAAMQQCRLAWLRISGAILCDGRVLVLCSDASKVSQSIMLRVDEKLYVIDVVEEEWRSDPDWWLSEDDRRSSWSTASETNSMQSDDDGHELFANGISGEDDDSIEAESLYKEGFFNSNLQEVTAGKDNAGFGLPREVGEVNGHDAGEANDEGNGLVGSDAHIGLEESFGLSKGPTGEEIKDKEEVSTGDVLENSCIVHKDKSRDGKGKRRKKIAECYPEEVYEIRTERVDLVTARTKQRQARRAKKAQTVTDEMVKRAGSMSVSDGGIEHRNQVLSFNVKGLGSTLKRKEVEKLVRLEKPDFLFVQETKLEEIDEGLCKMVWYSTGFEWVVKGSIGASGGLLCVWDRMRFTKLGQFTGDAYLGIKGLWGVKKELCYLVNVYAPTNRKKKAELWEELKQMIMDKRGRWLIAGDFNAVRSIEERRGRTGESPDMKEFNDFIEAVGLVDHKLANRRFTWYRPDGSAMSRLDRVLMTTKMTELGGEWVQQGLRRTISDHCAIIMKTKVTDWGPKPFRVLDAWQQHPEFKRVVEEQWNAMAVDGYAGFRCKQKLKMLKEFLREWNKGVFGDIEAHFERAAAKVASVDMKNEDFTLEEDEVHERQEGFQEIWDILRKREALWRQKLRSNWVKLGDANTRFFHKIANGRKACNGIVGLSCDRQWVEEPEMVKKAAVEYFQKMFCGESWNRPKPSSITFKQITEEMRAWLERPFSAEEIEDGLKNCEGNKAPGPDGYNFNFIKFAWNSLKEDFVSFFGEFHQHGRLVKGLNSSFLTLIPKKLNSVELKDFRPISLIGCIYKLLAKVLANKLKVVMSQIISDTQSAFVGGRQLVDGVLVLNEVVEKVKRRKHQAFIFKADFENAYDCADWSFLDWMMSRFGFGVQWRGWIKECLSTARISVLVNGSPIEEFMMGKGLRQGNPLSPFMFLMIAEGLHGLVKKVETKGLIHGIDVGSKGLNISLLQFADDTVILGKANGENIFTVKIILRWFELMSGLRINFRKSSIVEFNVAQRWLTEAASVLRCGVGEIPFVYLGMPRKIPWVSWEMVCRSKEKGGLGVMDLRRRNWALLGKWWFRLGEGGESLWKRVMWDKYYYGGRRKADIRAVESLRMSRIWRDVISVGGKSIKLHDMLRKGFRWMVGDGRRVGFWREIWVGGKSLKELCPRLFELAMNKDGMVCEMGVWERGLWRWNVDWRRGMLGQERGEEVVLWEVLSRVQITEGREDCWKWMHDAEGRYVVKKAYEFLSPMEFILPDHIWSWYIWYWRNIRVFQNKGECRDGLLHMIQSKTFFWIKNKVAGSVFSIVDWKLNPWECAAAMRKHKSLLRTFHKHKNGRQDE